MNAEQEQDAGKGALRDQTDSARPEHAQRPSGSWWAIPTCSAGVSLIHVRRLLVKKFSSCMPHLCLAWVCSTWARAALTVLHQNAFACLTSG